MENSKHLIDAMKLKVDLTGIPIPAPLVELIEKERSPSRIFNSVTRCGPKLEVSSFQVVEMNQAIDDAILQLEEFRQTLMNNFDDRIKTKNHIEAAQNL
ncbi:hypothetical protein KI655_18535 [Vibrio sp. D404a]|uniref:hypothetical protein n=1 Tax=unclassified Vibrio TaxID=2614977 RepID=UPI002552A2AE|nr:MULTISPECIES: hypothetical protein [unclassified Vibrio]MDK9739296.1 hypothetical protein [Vibrio sp. D404a]MDK9797668.1 hypothetical protein [Vibrio sp. D449a]